MPIEQAWPTYSLSVADHLTSERDVVLVSAGAATGSRAGSCTIIGAISFFDGGTSFKDCVQVSHGLAILRHGPKIALLHYAAHMFVRPGLDPHRVGTLQQQCISFGTRHDAARSRDHGSGMFGDDTFQAGVFVTAEGRKPADLDQIGDARAIILLDQAVELDERTAEMLGKTPAERRFSRSA